MTKQQPVDDQRFLYYCERCNRFGWCTLPPVSIQHINDDCCETCGRPRSNPPAHESPDGEAQRFDGSGDAEREAPGQVLGTRPVDYEDTRRRVVEYLDRCVDDVFNREATAKFLERTDSVVRVKITACQKSEASSDKGFIDWLSGLANELGEGKDVGKLTIDPDGNSTLITVQK